MILYLDFQVTARQRHEAASLPTIGDSVQIKKLMVSEWNTRMELVSESREVMSKMFERYTDSVVRLREVLQQLRLIDETTKFQ